MSGFHWVTRAGRDWQVLHDELEPDRLRMGLLLDYGRIDEPPERLGVLGLLTAALRAELQRPVELGGGEVSVPEVEVTANVAWITIEIRGRRRAVLAAWDRLGELFARPSLSVSAVPVPVRPQYWFEDLATYTGVNAETLSQLALRTTPDLAAAELLLAHLAPSACQVRHVLYTDDPYAVGAGWSGEASYGSAPIRPARFRDRRPALVPCMDDSVLLAVAAPISAEGTAGIRALAWRLTAILSEMRLEASMRVEVAPIRDIEVVTFLAANGSFTGVGRRRILDQVLQPALPLPDSVIERALSSIEPEEVAILSRWRRLWGLDRGASHDGPGGAGAVGADAQEPMDLDAEWAALMASGELDGQRDATQAVLAPEATDIDGQATGPGQATSRSRRESSEDDPEQDRGLAVPTPAQVRRVVEEMLGSVHTVLGDETSDLAVQGNFVCWREPECRYGEPIVLARGDLGDGTAFDVARPHIVELGDRVLAVSWYEWECVRGSWKPRHLCARRWIDLGALSLAARGDDTVVLVDDRLRRICLPWAQVAAHPEIKALLERHGLARVPWFSIGD